MASPQILSPLAEHYHRIVVGSDHAGYPLKSVLVPWLSEQGLVVVDVGTHSTDSVDYPDFGHAAARALRNGEAEVGLLICGSGIGIGIAANRHDGIRAATCYDATQAQLAREHNDANILVLGARLTSESLAKDILSVFLRAPFAGGRHATRVEKLG